MFVQNKKNAIIWKFIYTRRAQALWTHDPIQHIVLWLFCEGTGRSATVRQTFYQFISADI